MKKFFIYLMKEGSVLKVRAANKAAAKEKVEKELGNWEFLSRTGNIFKVVSEISEIKEIGPMLFEVTITPPRLENAIEAINQEVAINMIAALLGLSTDEMWAEEVTT